MRLLHTSDWHLGHTLHDLPRDYEHERFLEWLQEQIHGFDVHALLISGDIFETANPPAAAQTFWYRFLAETRRRYPHLDIVAIGGNHDSAARLDAPAALLREFGVRMVGGLPRLQDGSLDLDRLVVPLHGPGGDIAAWVCAVPFLRPADLPAVEPEADFDPLIEGVRAIYATVIAHARKLRKPGQAIVAMGHCYMVGTALSELSERKILGGNQHALPADIFPADVAYVALGHLHRAQEVGGQDRICYSGSPIPLSLAESGYRHQIRIVDLEGDRMTGLRVVPVPRFVDMLSVPERDPAPLPEVLRILRALPAPDPALPQAARPFLEVRVVLERPEPGATRQIVEALEGKAVRLVKVTPTYLVKGRDIPFGTDTSTLSDLREEDVFRAMYARNPGGDPPPELLAAFHELLEEARAQEATA